MDIPGIALKAEAKQPIIRYGIDRTTLFKEGIPDETIDRVYRGLFVYSMGFYELLQKIISHSPNKYTVVTNLWRVYAVLLEYCNRSDYKMLISQVQADNQTKL